LQPESKAGDLLELPTPQPAVEVALEELEFVYAFLYARVANRADAEDLAQQVAMKAIPRLREGAAPQAIRSYLFATARSVLASFWARRFGLPEEELAEDLWLESQAPGNSSSDAGEKVDEILARLPANYRRLLELRFLRGYSLREVAAEMGSTVGAIKVMQLRALRAAAKATADG
jgi:RNA polymerase sigma factor (sigma-70 family)